MKHSFFESSPFFSRNLSFFNSFFNSFQPFTIPKVSSQVKALSEKNQFDEPKKTAQSTQNNFETNQQSETTFSENTPTLSSPTKNKKKILNLSNRSTAPQNSNPTSLKHLDISFLPTTRVGVFSGVDPLCNAKWMVCSGNIHMHGHT